MNFIYDIVLNFNEDYYSFFEWDKKDNIINIKKIPLFLIDKDTFQNMKYNKVTVSKDFIEVIRDRTFTYSRVKVGLVALVTNGKEVMGVLFNDKGVLIKKSSLLLDEEEEVIDEINYDKIYDIDIIKVQKKKVDETNRIEKEKKKFLIKFISKETNNITLKYLYYDYFEEEEDNIELIKNKLIKEIKNNWSKKLNKFYDTVKIFNKIIN